MGKVLNALKKSAGSRKTPTTPSVAKPAQQDDRSHASANNNSSQAVAEKLADVIQQNAGSLDAVSQAVAQATRTASEKLTGSASTAQPVETKTPYAKPQMKELKPAKSAQKSASESVVKAVATGETIIRPQSAFKARITPTVENTASTASPSAAPQSPVADNQTNKAAKPDIASLISARMAEAAAAKKAAAPRPVSRAVNRAETMSSVLNSRGPVATRQSHYFSPLVVTYNNPRCQISEQFRHIRTALIRLANRGPVRCMITSSQPREGKTVTAVNMAYCFSEVTKKRTLLIDADLRRGRVSELLGMGRKNGLSELLNGECSIEEATWSAGRPNFHVITAGSSSIDQIGEMLSGEQAEQVMTNLSRMYDNIIIDSPPVISVADPAILCRWVDMALMAVRIHSTHCNLIEQATQILEGVGVHVTGLIALDDKASQRNYYRYVNYG